MKSEKVTVFFDWGAHEDDVGMDYDHCLCGLVNLRDMKTGKKAGSVRWGGGTKSFWVSEVRVLGRSELNLGSGLIGTVGFVAFMVRRFWVPLRDCRRSCIESFRAQFMLVSKLRSSEVPQVVTRRVVLEYLTRSEYHKFQQISSFHSLRSFKAINIIVSSRSIYLLQLKTFHLFYY